MKLNLRIFILVFIVIGILFISGCQDGKPIVCPPAGFPQPPGCGGKDSIADTMNKFIEKSERLAVDLYLTVPYWTQGDVYLGIGENATYLKLEKIDDILYQGKFEFESDADYYYSRGSLETKSIDTYTLNDVPTGINSVTDWIDSDKKIVIPGFQKGVLFGGSGWHPEKVGMSYAVDYNLELLKDFGVEWLVIDNMWFEFPDCSDAKEIKPFYIGDGEWPDTSGWSAPTKTDRQLKDLILKAKKMGFKIFLKPVVINFANGPTRNVACHQQMSDWDSWFEDYMEFALHFGRLAEETGVDMYSIGTELDIATDPDFTTLGPTNPTERWRAIVKEVRNVYSGKLTFSVSCTIDATKDVNNFDFPCNGPNGLKFWDDLDYIGFEPYFSITEKEDPSVAEIKQSFGERLDSALFTRAKQLHEQYNKPVIFTEISIRSYDGASRYQLQVPENPIVDIKEQADLLEGVFQAVEERPWIVGMHHWVWNIIPPGADTSWQLNDINTFNGKPGGQVIKKWYRKIED